MPTEAGERGERRNWIGHPAIAKLRVGMRVRLPDGYTGTVRSIDPQFDDAVTIKLDTGGLTSREPIAISLLDPKTPDE